MTQTDSILEEVKKSLTPDRIAEIRLHIKQFEVTLKDAPVLSFAVPPTEWAEKCGQFAGELLHALSRIEQLEAERAWIPVETKPRDGGEVYDEHANSAYSLSHMTEAQAEDFRGRCFNTEQ